MVQEMKDVAGSQRVETRNVLFCVISHHRVSFPTPSLSIGENCSFGSFESGSNQRLDGFLVELKSVILSALLLRL